VAYAVPVWPIFNPYTISLICKTREWTFDRVHNSRWPLYHLQYVLTLTFPFWHQKHTIYKLSQGHSLYQVWKLWDHSFLSYRGTNKRTQTHIQTLRVRFYNKIIIMIPLLTRLLSTWVYTVRNIMGRNCTSSVCCNIWLRVGIDNDAGIRNCTSFWQWRNSGWPRFRATQFRASRFRVSAHLNSAHYIK